MKVRRPFKLPGRPAWYVDIGRKRRSLRTTDYAHALKLYNEMCRRVEADNAASSGNLGNGGDGNKTLEQFAKIYLGWSKQARPIMTYRAEKYSLDKLRESAGDSVRVADLTGQHLDTLAAQGKEAGKSTNTVNLWIRHLKAIMGKAVVWQWIKENPFAKVKTLGIDVAPPRRLTAEDVGQLFKAVEDNPHLGALIKSYISTGRRRAELVNLNWDDVDLAAGTYHIRKAKDKHSRDYPIPSAFRAALESLPQPHVGRVFPWDHPDTVTHLVKKAFRDAGLDGYHLHHLRHTFGTMFLEAGGDVRTLMELMGHTQIATTQIYTRGLSKEHLAKEIERVKVA